MFNKWMSVLCISFACLCQSCHTRLSVRTEYFNQEELASYRVKTPDPALHCPLIGQRLIISWCLPKDDLDYEDLHLNLKIRCHTYQEEELNIPITNRRDYYVYVLTDKQYIDSGGFVTYEVKVMGGGSVLETWTHPLWKNYLILGTPET